VLPTASVPHNITFWITGGFFHELDVLPVQKSFFVFLQHVERNCNKHLIDMVCVMLVFDIGSVNEDMKL